MTLPGWTKWLLIMVPFLAAVAFLVWWFYFRDPTACPKGKTWDPILKDCVPDPESDGPPPPPPPPPGPQPRVETVTFDRSFSVPDPAKPNVFILGSEFLVVRFDEDPDAGWPRIDTLSGNAHIRHTIEGTARLGGFGKTFKVILWGLQTDNRWVSIQSTEIAGSPSPGKEEDVNLAAVPGIKLKAVLVKAIETSPFGDALGYWPNPFALAGHLAFPFPLRVQGSCIVTYG